MQINKAEKKGYRQVALARYYEGEGGNLLSFEDARKNIEEAKNNLIKEEVNESKDRKETTDVVTIGALNQRSLSNIITDTRKDLFLFI